MTYKEQNDLMTDLVFQGRIKVAVLKYATSILDEEPTVTAHNTRLKWATNAAQNPQVVSQTLQPNVVMDANVQTAGSAITDELLQGSVEATVNKLM
jgi:hypothetical protein